MPKYNWAATKDDFSAILMHLPTLGISAIFLSSAWLSGDIFRGASSPWFWDQIPVERSHGGGTADVVVMVAMYLMYYSAGFVVPFLFALVVFYLTTQNKYSNADLGIDGIAGAFIVGVGGLILFLACQNSVYSFLRALSATNLLISIVGVLFLVIGLRQLLLERARAIVEVPVQYSVFRECRRCKMINETTGNDMRGAWDARNVKPVGWIEVVAEAGVERGWRVGRKRARRPPLA